MKKLSVFCCGFLLMIGFNVKAATSSLPYIFPQLPKTVILSDSGRVKAPIVDNNPATLSTLSGLIGGISTFAGIMASGRGLVAGIVVGGIFGIMAIIAGGIAIKKRRKLLNTTYLQDPEARKLPLGQGRSIFGIFLGIITTGIMIFLLGFIIAYTIS